MSAGKLSIGQLEIIGQNGEPLANRYFHHSIPASSLAVVYPGWQYNCDKPLLYYTSQALVTRKMDLLQMLVDYSRPELATLSQTDLTLRMVSEAQIILQAGILARSYQSLILVGKSIGTLVMAFILSQEHPVKIAATIWLTPLLQIPFVAAAIQNTKAPAIVAGGTADTTFDPAGLALVKGLPNISLLCVEGANHSLEITDDPRLSLIALSSLVDRILNMVI